MFVCFIGLIEQQLGQKNIVSKAYFKRRATGWAELKWLWPDNRTAVASNSEFNSLESKIGKKFSSLKIILNSLQATQADTAGYEFIQTEFSSERQ